MEFDLEIDNWDSSKFGTGKFNLYFLKEKNFDLTPLMYGNGLPKDTGGLTIAIRENTKNLKEDSGRKVKGH